MTSINDILVKCLLGPRSSSPSLEVHEVKMVVGPEAGLEVGEVEEDRGEDGEEYSGVTEYPQYTIKVGYNFRVVQRDLINTGIKRRHLGICSE